MKTSHEQIRLLSPKYRKPSDHCKCPKILSHLFRRHKGPLTERIQSLKNKPGMQKRAADLFVLGRKHYECPQTSKPLKKIVRSHAGTQKAKTLCILEAFLHQLWVHTHTIINKCVCNYSLSWSCFLISSTSEEKKREKDAELPSNTELVFLYSESTRWLTKR